MTRFETSFSAAANGQVKYLSWRSLITGAAAPRGIARFVEVQPRWIQRLERAKKPATPFAHGACALA